MTPTLREGSARKCAFSLTSFVLIGAALLAVPEGAARATPTPTFSPATATLAPAEVRRMARDATKDGLEGCAVARLLTPHLDNLGLAERDAVIERWRAAPSHPELRAYGDSLASPHGTALPKPALLVCATPADELPIDGPNAGNACFGGVHPTRWQEVEAGHDGLVWLDDRVPGTADGGAWNLHVVGLLPALGADGSVRIGAAASALDLTLVARASPSPIDAPAATARYALGPLRDATHDQLVLPWPRVVSSAAGTPGWFHALIVPATGGATRLRVRAAGLDGRDARLKEADGRDARLKEAAAWPSKGEFLTAISTTSAPPTRAPSHPCAPHDPLLRHAFNAALGLSTASSEALAANLGASPRDIERALLVLPNLHPESIRATLLGRLADVAEPKARPRLVKAIAAIALEQASASRAAWLLGATDDARQPTDGTVDGLGARLALAEGRAGTTADILSVCRTSPHCPAPMIALLVRALLDVGLTADARDVLNTHDPDARSPHLAALRDSVQTGPDFADATKARARAMSDASPTRALLRLASARAHLRAGDRDGAMTELGRLRGPDSPTGWVRPAGTRVQMAELLIDLEQIDDARAVLAWTLADAPSDPWARALSEQLRARDASEPGPMRDVLAKVPGPIVQQFRSSPDALLALHALPRRAAPGAWEILGEQLIVDVAPDGRATRLGRRVMRRGDASPGAAPPAAMRWSWDPSRVSLELVRAVVHRPTTDANGRRNLASRPLRGVTVESPDRAQIGLYYDEMELVVPWDKVRPDELLEVVYTVVPVGQPFPGYFELIEFLTSRVPRHALDVLLLTPATLDVETRVLGPTDANPRVATEDENMDHQRVRRFTLRDDPGLRVEPFAPPHAETGLVLQATTVRSFDALGEFYSGLMRRQAHLTSEMREAVAEVVARNRTRAGGLNELGVARELSDLVARQVRYVGMEFGIHGYQPYRTDDVWRRRFGDCKDQALLLVMLLAEAGIEARPVLVRTRRLGHLGESGMPPLPMLALFDHAIVQLTARDHFVDPTTIHHGFDTLAPDNLDADALVVPWRPGDRAVVRRLPPGIATRNGVEGDFAVLLESDGSALIQGRIGYRGTQAGAWRARLANEATRDQLVQSMIGNTFRGFELSHFNVSGLDGSAAQLRIVFEGRVHQLARRDGASLRIAPPLPLGGQRQRLGPIAERVLPFVFGTPGTGAFEVAWTLPRGFGVERVPDAFSRTTANARAEITWRPPEHIDAGPLTVTGRVELAFLTEQVPPAALSDLAAALEALDDAVATPLVVSPLAGQDDRGEGP